MPNRFLHLNHWPTLDERALLSLVEWQHPALLLTRQTDTTTPTGFDIFTANPVTTVVIDRLTASEASVTETADSVIQALDKYTTIASSATRSTAIPQTDALPFTSGAIGLVSYDAGAALNGVDSCGQPSHAWPDVLVGIYQWAIIYCHRTGECLLAGDDKLEQSMWDKLVALFSNANPDPQEFAERSCLDRQENAVEWQSNTRRNEYNQAFETLKTAIEEGDCYQANLTRQYAGRFSGDVAVAAERCWQASPAPYSAFIQHQNHAVVSCSPERFIQIKDGLVSTQPIKGTRPRLASEADDILQQEALKTSAKERAENLMIVDLMRNDLGKHCEVDSISVPRLFDIESFSNVHHLVSEVTGKIKANNSRASLELFLSCLPGGSITGAPKRSALQIIAQLESHTRSIYCGSLFYLNCDGNLDSNIMIRSLLFEANSDSKEATAWNGTVYCWGGGGIVADSHCEDEWLESQQKIENLLQALGC